MNRKEPLADSPLKCPLQLRAEKLIKKRVTTPWSRSELTAWAGAKAILADTTEGEWADLEKWFSLPTAPFRRQALAALLNNWQAEILRCRLPDNAALMSATRDLLAETESAARRNAF